MLGISTDSVKSHQRFATRLNLPYPILSDPDGETAQAYGVIKSLRPLITVARRVSFLVDEKGKIAKIWDPVKARTHHQQVLDYLSESEIA